MSEIKDSIHWKERIGAGMRHMLKSAAAGIDEVSPEIVELLTELNKTIGR